MLTTEPSDTDLEHIVDAEIVPDDQPTTLMSRAVRASYNRAKKASVAKDAESTVQVAECRRKRDGIVSTRVPARGKQRTLFDF